MRQIVISGNDLWLERRGDTLSLPSSVALPSDGSGLFRFGPDGEYVAFQAPSVEIPAGLELRGLRESHALLPADDYAAASKGAELIHWHASMRYCPACGTLLRRGGPISKICPACGSEHFPSLIPAVVVLVIRGREALLVHAANFRRPFYALVAGFVETGETLEQCVAREVREETTLEIDDIRYRGSQSWPFPAQLMLGFTARYRAGEVTFADGELTSGGFFSRDSLPMLPTPPSLSRALIDAWTRGDFD